MCLVDQSKRCLEQKCFRRCLGNGCHGIARSQRIPVLLEGFGISSACWSCICPKEAFFGSVYILQYHYSSCLNYKEIYFYEKCSACLVFKLCFIYLTVNYVHVITLVKCW